jgi:hypothetical protein
MALIRKSNAQRICSLVLLVATTRLYAAVPPGWVLAGSKPASYEVGTQESVNYQGHRSVYLKSIAAVNEGFGTLMQSFGAGKYEGKRVRFSAAVKSQAIEDWAGLWMRVDKGSQSVALDNMQNRAIRGTSEWQQYEVVLDVPDGATGISFGVLLSRTGSVWMSDVKFEIVDTSVPTTGSSRNDGPTNLGFEQ